MGHPVNGIQYLINEWNYLKNRYSYYAFFLFTESDKNFAELFQEMMFRWDDISGDGTMFFAVAPPPKGWEEKAGDRHYWKHFKANSHKDIDYDDDSVKQVARYFNISESNFPNVVVFSDLRKTETLTIELSGLSTAETKNYIENIFLLLNNSTVRRYRQLWKIHLLLDDLPIDKCVDIQWINSYVNSMWDIKRRRHFQKKHGKPIPFAKVASNHRVIRHETTIPIEQTIQSILQEMRRLTDEVAELRHEQREQFANVNFSLERIENVLNETINRIEKYRIHFVERWLDAEYSASSFEELSLIREKLTQDFDDFLLTQRDHLTRRIRSSFQIPQELNLYNDILESNSRAALESSEALWNYFRINPYENKGDYSICGIGLWKALEIELNRTVVDTLRVHHGIANTGTPSVIQLVEYKDKYKEVGWFGSQGYKPVIINPYTDSDPEIRQKQLKGITLGTLAALLQGISRNNLNSLIAKIKINLATTDTSHLDFITNVGEQVQIITNRYRNVHAHLRQMDRNTYKSFRQLMLDDNQPHSPLFRILECKRELENNGMI
ncbi:hypothetical protein GF357_04725 [Candidatus Dojkabacteria bacterium]|nr:hypothetical protein [Candidatus Dojkabacteria bacterium]